MTCVHRWLIDNHNYGRCKLCGAERQFESTYGHDQELALLLTKCPYPVTSEARSGSNKEGLDLATRQSWPRV